jgi:hypothetical protein
MRHHGFLLGGNAGLREVPIPPGARIKSAASLRRRLDDSLVDICSRAVASNNLDGAADLLEIMEKWHERRKVKYGRERRIHDAELTAMRTALNQLRALRTS